ncbi:proteasome subunit beta type-2-like [Oscarella lobularis]|uniref:proteasome subunit beta type-2-like n=1 Tax=Oscarella lobularis TaxID=121494 RepID=UPI003313441A
MECLLGIAGKDFVVFASDSMASHSIIVIKDDVNKMFQMDDRLAMVVSGAPGDTTTFGELIQRNVQLYKIRHGYSLSPHAAASFTRQNLAKALREGPYQVDMLIGGYDEHDGAALYFMDYLGTMDKVPYAAHGYASYMTLSIMDRHYREDLTKEEAIGIIKKCIAEVQKRLVINLPKFNVHTVDKEGVHTSNDAEELMES